MALTTPFAQNGDKKAIPQNTSDGSVSFDRGFGSFYALPPEEGGLFIDRAQFNQLMYDTTSAVIDNSDNITTIQGDLATAQSNITTLQQKTSNLENSVSNINNTISQVVSSDVTPIGVYKNVVDNKTIGANGDFKTIHDAFLYVQTHQKHSLEQSIKLTLLENLNDDIYFRGAWYPYLVIDCNGFVLANKLTIDISCFTIHNLKLNNRLVAASSILWFGDGDININYPIDDYPGGCITGLAGSIITVGGRNLNFSTTINRSAFHSLGNSMIHISSSSTITQTTGGNCFSVSAGGIIQLADGINLTGVTVPKANQAANQITNNGLIIGNYYSI